MDLCTAKFSQINFSWKQIYVATPATQRIRYLFRILNHFQGIWAYWNVTECLWLQSKQVARCENLWATNLFGSNDYFENEQIENFRLSSSLARVKHAQFKTNRENIGFSTKQVSVQTGHTSAWKAFKMI